MRSLAGATAGEAVIGMPPTVGRVLAVPLTLSLDVLQKRLEALADDLMVELVLDAS